MHHAAGIDPSQIRMHDINWTEIYCPDSGKIYIISYLPMMKLFFFFKTEPEIQSQMAFLTSRVQHRYTPIDVCMYAEQKQIAVVGLMMSFWRNLCL